MKKINFKISIIIILIIINLINVPFVFTACPEYVNCKNRAYPFKFCDADGNIVTLCSKDPNTMKDNRDPFYSNNIYPLKLASGIPICAQFDNSGPDNIKVSICGNQTCSSGDVYFKSDFINDLNYALDRLNCLCGVQDAPCICTITVTFIDINNGQFSDPENDIASNSVIINENGAVTDNCQINCNNLKIYLNNTKEFTGRTDASGNYYSGNFYVSSSIANNWTWPVGYGPDAYNLVTVLSQQLGEIMGLPYGEYDAYTNDCTDGGGVMSAINKATDIQATDLSIADKCMFEKLYCPNYVPVKENELVNVDNNIENYPNPFNNNIKISFNVTNKNGSVVAIKIYNLCSQVIQQYDDKYYQQGNWTENFFTYDIEPGIYLCYIKIDNNISIKKIVCVK